jgi:ubiquitin-like domain-containing CTD phosphatase 1
MGPLWKEIMANILPIVDSDRHPPSGTPPPKLALFSGHDTTLMPLLATLGARVWSGTEWAPYASMVMIEIHRMTAEDAAFRSGYGFRLIYNGEVLTSKMDGCSAELCDARVLVEQVMPFAKYQDRDCAASVKTENVMEEMKDAAESLVAAPGGVWALASLMIVSMTVGGMLTYFWMKRGMIKAPIYRQESTRVTNEDPGIDLSVSAQYGGVQNETALGETNLI